MMMQMMSDNTFHATSIIEFLELGQTYRPILLVGRTQALIEVNLYSQGELLYCEKYQLYASITN